MVLLKHSPGVFLIIAAQRTEMDVHKGRDIHPFSFCMFPFVESSFCPEVRSPILVNPVVPLARLETMLCESMLSLNCGPTGAKSRPLLLHLEEENPTCAKIGAWVSIHWGVAMMIVTHPEL